MSSDDAYGQLLHDLLDGKDAFEIVERDDGFVYVFAAREVNRMTTVRACSRHRER
jgi:hypothetical protein